MQDSKFPQIPNGAKQAAIRKAEEKVQLDDNVNSKDSKEDSSQELDYRIDYRIALINEKLENSKLTLKEKLIFDILGKENNLSEPRKEMQKKIIWFLWAQLFFLSALIVGVFVSKGWKESFSDEVFLKILNFLEFYITAIISEFIAMIFFVVKYLFNTKLIDVVKSWVNKL